MKHKETIRDLGLMLKRLGYLKGAEEIIKLGYINQAKIIIDPSTNKLSLMGEIRDREYGEDYLVRYGGVILTLVNLGGVDFYHIHSGINSEYIGLGYGRDLYYAAIEWASNEGKWIISIPYKSPKTEDSIIMSNRLIKDPAIDHIMILRVNDELYKLTNLSMRKLKEILKEKYEDLFGRGVVFGREYVHAKDLNNFLKNDIGYDEIDNLNKVILSIGYIFNKKDGKLPISIPVEVDYGVIDKKKKVELTYGELAQKERIKCLEIIRDEQVRLIKKDKLTKDEEDYYKYLIDPNNSKGEKLYYLCEEIRKNRLNR